MSSPNVTYGVQGLWVIRASMAALIVNVETVTFTDSTALVESKNSFGVTTNIFTADRPCSWAFTAQDISPLAKSIMTGYDLLGKEATTARTAHVQNRVGDWSGAFTVAADTAVGVYFLYSIDGAKATVQKLLALDANVIKRSPPAALEELPGLTIDFSDIEAGDSCVVTIQPPAVERGVTAVDPFITRPSFTLSAASDGRAGASDKQNCVVYAPEILVAEMPTSFSTLATSSSEFSGMVNYSSKINAYFQIQDIVG